MIRQHELDWEESRRVLDACGTKIRPKDCYRNTFHVLAMLGNEIQKNQWKVGFGYVEALPNVMVRHAFWVANEKVIDPTIALINNPNDQSKTYLTFRIFSVEEYLQALHEEDGDSSLHLCNREAEREAYAWAKSQGIILCG